MAIPRHIITLGLFLYVLVGFAHSWMRWSPMEGDLYQGDIKLKADEDPFTKGAVANRNRRWPNKRVYYVIGQEYDDVNVKKIKQALAEIQKQTCIRFTEGTGNGDYLHVRNLDGCWSYVGRVGGAQNISLKNPGCLSKGTIMHEFMHALGFWHEQSRADRDDHVNIHWDNIPTQRQHNFQKQLPLAIDHLNTSYDVRSIMHYHAWSFAIDRLQPTVSPKDNQYQLEDLGWGSSNNQLTYTDALRMRRYYEC